MSDRLAVSITHADGTVTRWGDDEPLAESILQDLTFSTSIPGGYKNCTGTLLRLITRDYPDLNLFDTIRIYGPGNVTVFEGRMVQFPRSHGDSYSISPSAVGWSAHLLDDPSFREIYVDRDFTQWQSSSVARQLALVSGGEAPQSFSVVADDATGQPALLTSFTGAWTATSLPESEAIYDAGGGVSIGSVYYAWKRNANVSAGPDNFQWSVLLADDDVLTNQNNTGDLQAAGPGTGTLTASGVAKRYANLNLRWMTTAAGVQGALYGVYWTCLAVYGTHGLTKQGTSSATTAQGFYASDVIANIVSRTAPLLNYTTGSSGSIQPTTFVIPHLVFSEPTTGSDAISFVNAYHQYDWGVYDNKQFFFRPADPNTLTWEARLSEGARVDLEGDTAEQVYNGVYVTYTDATGSQKTVGPPGAAADNTDTVLADTSTANPVNAAGIPRRWAMVNVTQPTNLAGATQIGFVWLAEHSLPQRRGTLTLTGTATHPTEGKVPVWRVRAGDFIRISDHPADVPRRVIETNYVHANGGVLTATLDNTVFKLESIIERALGVQMVGVL